MKREIKFRAIDERGVWWYFSLEDLINPEVVSCRTGVLKNWCEFTGLKDKNGKEIFEGDIVIRNIYTIESGRKEMSKPFVIIWDDKKAGFDYKTDGYHSGLFYEVHEIIGNIYENPELLS